MFRRDFFRLALASLGTLFAGTSVGIAKDKPVYVTRGRTLYRLLKCPHCESTNLHRPLIRYTDTTEYRCAYCGDVSIRKTGCKKTEKPAIYSIEEIEQMREELRRMSRTV